MSATALAGTQGELGFFRAASETGRTSAGGVYTFFLRICDFGTAVSQRGQM
jgi:hypothetical protein